jgi:tRNA threonylcarbamoyl adenosine modification protein (Sua5/YciO/YrdC/YwlC family)
MSTIEAAAAALHRGLVIGMPTDTVYGLAVDPYNVAAVEFLFELKGRPADKPIPILTASLAQALEIVDMPPAIEALALQHWPGPLTLVLRSHVDLPEWVGNRERRTVAVRVPDHPVALDLLAVAGPLAVTSANPSGAEPATDHDEARALFGGKVAVYLEGTCPGGESSTVVDVTTDPPMLLRDGPVRFDIPELRP